MAKSDSTAVVPPKIYDWRNFQYTPGSQNLAAAPGDFVQQMQNSVQNAQQGADSQLSALAAMLARRNQQAQPQNTWLQVLSRYGVKR